MADFTQQINAFESTGIYNYQFDLMGNEILSVSSSVFQQTYLALPTANFQYNDSKILSFYTPTFTEFFPTTSSITSSVTIPQDVVDRISQLTTQNQSLQNQLNQVVSTNEFSTASADQQQIEDIILNLRIQLGQGSSSADFQTTFPYYPIPLENKNL